MWFKAETMEISEFIPYLVNTKPEKLKGVRFVYRRDNIIYVANFDTFGETMPDNMNNNHQIEIWEWED